MAFGESYRQRTNHAIWTSWGNKRPIRVGVGILLAQEAISDEELTQRILFWLVQH